MLLYKTLRVLGSVSTSFSSSRNKFICRTNLFLTCRTEFLNCFLISSYNSDNDHILVQVSTSKLNSTGDQSDRQWVPLSKGLTLWAPSAIHTGAPLNLTHFPWRTTGSMLYTDAAIPRCKVIDVIVRYLRRWRVSHLTNPYPCRIGTVVCWMRRGA